MKTMQLWRIAFMMLAAFSLASCCSNDSEQDKPFTVCPEEQIRFYACEKSGETRGETATIDTLFTEPTLPNVGIFLPSLTKICHTHYIRDCKLTV